MPVVDRVEAYECGEQADVKLRVSSTFLREYDKVAPSPHSIRPGLRGDLMLDFDPDQIGGSGKAKLVLHFSAIVRHGFVAETDRIGDLQHAVAFAEELENLQIAGRQIL